MARYFIICYNIVRYATKNNKKKLEKNIIFISKMKMNLDYFIWKES